MFQYKMHLLFSFSSGTGHYTQMVWSNTDRLGCGQVTYDSRNGFVAKYLVCNYGKAGNFMGTPMYSVGQACSKCSSGCSVRYPGLCSTTGGEIAHN